MAILVVLRYGAKKIIILTNGWKYTIEINKVFSSDVGYGQPSIRMAQDKRMKKDMRLVQIEFKFDVGEGKRGVQPPFIDISDFFAYQRSTSLSTMAESVHTSKGDIFFG